MSFIVQTLTTSETLVVEQCCKCMCYFAMPKDLWERAKQSEREFFCPNGHGQVYTKTENSKLKAQIQQLENDAIRRKQYIDEQNNTIEQLGYSLRAQKAAKTKIMNRVKNGVCPCCNRTFKDLQSHFKTKHPELLSGERANA